MFHIPFQFLFLLIAYAPLLAQYPVIVSISLSWPCPACDTSSHSTLICDSFQFLLSISLRLSSLDAFHSICPCLSCSLNYLCCAIHLCHFTLSALDLVCCCILTASLFSALFFIHDCHSMHTCHSMDTFPVPHAPHLIAVAFYTLYHVDSCLMLLFSCLLFNSHMPHLCYSLQSCLSFLSCFLPASCFLPIYPFFNHFPFLCLSPSPSCMLHAQFLFVH